MSWSTPSGRPTLAADGADWPLRDASQMIEAGGLNWHVQMMGEGPTLLLAHGTGAATHSWRDLAPLLARRFRLIAPDLPGHGFTSAKREPDLTLPGMAKALGALLKTLDVGPAVVVGHSAGAAILAQMVLDGKIEPKLLVSLNGAFLPFGGAAGSIFPSIARLLFVNPLAPRVLAWTADRAAVVRLMKGTGSVIDARGVALYARLFANPAHVAGALGMMANWDLRSLCRALPRLPTPTLFVVGDKDLAIPPSSAWRLAKGMPRARVEIVPSAGHLVHEERPEQVAAIIIAEAERCGILPHM